MTLTADAETFYGELFTFLAGYSFAPPPPPPPPPPPARFLQDSFTDTDGVLLTAHAPEIGQGWVDYAGSNVATIQSGRIFGSAAGVLRNLTPPWKADYFVEAVLDAVTNAGNDNLGPCGRLIAGGNDGYFFRFSKTAFAWQLYKIVNGNASPLGSAFADTWTSGNRTAKLEMIGNTINGYVDGTLRCSVTDNTFSSAGYPGFKFSVAQTSTTGRQVTSLNAEVL